MLLESQIHTDEKTSRLVFWGLDLRYKSISKKAALMRFPEKCNSVSFYYKRYMKDAGLPVPTGGFSTLAQITSSIAAMEKAISKFGPNVPVHYILMTAPGLASAASDVLVATMAITASFYLGASLAALSMASGTYSGCILYENTLGKTYTKVTGKNQIPEWLVLFCRKNSGLIEKMSKTGKAFA